jgi:hypothetical protein
MTTAEVKQYFLDKKHLEKGGCDMFLQVKACRKVFWVPFRCFVTRTVTNILVVMN